MSDDEIERAQALLRRFGAESIEPARAAATRRRALATLTAGGTTRRSVGTCLLAGVLLAIACGAFAQLGGWPLLRAALWPEPAREPAPPTARSHERRSRTGQERGTSEQAEAKPSPAPAREGPGPDPLAPSAARASARARAQPRARASDAGADPSAAPGARDAETAQYRRAHALHFAGGRAGEALAAWDAYLRAYPAGVLAPEARYNRAIALLQLNRLREARAALTPIACQPEGAYRRAEARALGARIAARMPELPAFACDSRSERAQ